MIKPPAQSSVHLLANRAFICLHKKPSPAGAAEGCVKDKLKFITSCAGRLFDAGQLMIGRASLSVRLLKLAWPVAANVSRGSVSLGAWFGFAFLATVLCELCGKEELNREERQGFAKDAKHGCVVWLCVLGGSLLRALR